MADVKTNDVNLKTMIELAVKESRAERADCTMGDVMENIAARLMVALRDREEELVEARDEVDRLESALDVFMGLASMQTARLREIGEMGIGETTGR